MSSDENEKETGPNDHTGRHAWLIVVPIALLIAGLAVYVHHIDQTYKYAGSRNDLVQIGAALRAHYENFGSPPDAKALQALRPSPLPWRDAWGTPVVVEMGSGGFLLKSYGSDGSAGGHGAAEDIVVRWKIGQSSLSVESAAIDP